MTTTQPTTLTTAPVERPTAPMLSASDTLTVIAWHDPTVDQASGAMPTDSDDALVWYTPSVGTIGMAMAHRFARYATDAPTRWTVDEMAATFGLARSAGRVFRSLDRLERFDIARRHIDVVEVRLWLPPLSRRHVDQLPAYLAAGATPGTTR